MIFTFPAMAHAAIPELINFQGKLTDPSGRAITATVQMVFKLYLGATGGSEVWSEIQDITPDSYGIYSVNLGDVNPFDVSFSTSYWLGVKVGTDVEMTPRYKMVASAYSLYSVNSGTATYSITSGTAAYSITSGTAAYSITSGTAAYSVNSGTAAWATATDWAGIANKPALVTGNVVLSATQTFTGQNSFNNMVTVSSDVAVAGQIKIAGGAPGTGKVLTSDTNGLASWVMVSSGDVVLAATQTFTGQNTFSNGLFFDTGIWSTGGGLFNHVGAARGAGNVDLQTVRSLATQVASGGFSVIGGGQDNTASGGNSTISGGGSNTASNSYATVSGGFLNTAKGNNATVPGGSWNTAKGDNSFAAGLRSSSTANGSFTWADSEGTEVTNNVDDRTWFKNRGGFLISNTAVANNAAFAVDSTGKVGIGTLTPSEKLEVNGGIKIGTSDNTNVGTLRFKAGDFEGYNGSAWVLLNGSYSIYSSTMSWEKGDNNTIYALTTSSNVAIGSDNSGGDNKLRITGATDDGSKYALRAENFSKNGLLIVRNDGNIGVGTDNPGAKLEVAGQVKITGGAPDTGKVLTSDADGLASWQTAGDNLGNHTATEDIKMNNFYLINGDVPQPGHSNFIGNGAGSGATNAYSSNFLGNSAGGGALDANYSNFLGAGAGNGATRASGSNFLGADTGDSATDSNDSNFFGSAAGSGATRASYSNFLGNSAGSDATDASYSNFLGNNAGLTASGASYSNFLGFQAGAGPFDPNNSAYSNFLGNSAGSSASEAHDSNFLGHSAGEGATSSSNSNFLGFQAGMSATDAAGSNFLGANAGWGAIDAANSNFLGANAGVNAANAAGSNFLGASAGQEATSAVDSDFLGNNAGNGATYAANSIFIGAFAGSGDFVDNTSGGTSIAIGRYAGTGGYSDSIAIGHGVINSALQQLNIGNVLYATGIYADTNDEQSSAPVVDGGRVGIRTNEPQATLDINGFMRLKRNSSEPVPCEGTTDGSIALTNGTGTDICICNAGGGGWLLAMTANPCVWYYP